MGDRIHAEGSFGEAASVTLLLAITKARICANHKDSKRAGRGQVAAGGFSQR